MVATGVLVAVDDGDGVKVLVAVGVSVGVPVSLGTGVRLAVGETVIVGEGEAVQLACGVGYRKVGVGEPSTNNVGSAPPTADAALGPNAAKPTNPHSAITVSATMTTDTRLYMRFGPLDESGFIDRSLCYIQFTG